MRCNNLLIALGLFAIVGCSTIAKAELPPGVTPQDIKDTVSRILDNEITYKHAIKLLDCGISLPHKTADLILHNGYAMPEEKELNLTALHRLDEVLRIFHQYLGAQIIVTGSGYPETGLADRAKEYLIKHRVSSNKLIMDASAKTTYETLEHADITFKEKHAKSVIIVSSPYHIDRLLRYYEKLVRDDPNAVKNMYVYWSSYDEHKDDIQAAERRKQVVHEYYTVINDYWRYGNPLRSDKCSEQDKRRGSSDEYAKLVQTMMNEVKRKGVEVSP